MNVGSSQLFTKIPGITAKVGDSALQNGDSVCRKDIGETKKLGQWSRGYQVIVGGGGNVRTSICEFQYNL